MSELAIFIVDAFVGMLKNHALRGNPAAVVILDAPRDEAWMQDIAAEMNLSETAFVTPKNAEKFDLRWFTPLCEVKLCGHATLASAHVLWETRRVSPDQTIHFHTLSGILSAKNEGEVICLEFPAQKTVSCALPAGLETALKIENHYIVGVERAVDDLIVELNHETLVEHLEPDFERVGRFCAENGVRGIVVTAQAEFQVGFDFVSRFFAPAVGINEDPVTGSAHTKLAPFWGNRLEKTHLIGFQASTRGGLVEMKWHGERVDLLGRAATRMCGELLF